MPEPNVTPDSAAPSPIRPYRSHKIPACDFCRRRKSRCTQDLVDQPCLLCRMHGAACSTAKRGLGDASPRADTPTTTTRRRRVSRKASQNTDKHQSRLSRTAAARHSPVEEEQLRPAPQVSTANDTNNQSSHIVGPAMARDAQVLQRYMSPVYDTAVSYARPNPYSVYSHDPRDPVVYMKVPRQRNIVPSGNGTAGFKQFESMEKIIEPLGPELCHVYFENIHPPFPILDENTVLEAYRQDGLPHTLVCEIYAVSLILWKTSRKIASSGRPPPDIRYMWNLAVSAMNDDFSAPDFSTVLACILDLLGRPITSITYNAVNIGRVVALSQSLGLNRNPLKWDLEFRQKSLRIRTWWGILIHDQWASLSHGTPPHIHRSQWDVPLPDSGSLLINNAFTDGFVADARAQGGRSFIALCELTVVLGGILSLLYTLEDQTREQAFRALRRHEMALDQWEEGLPPWLCPGSLSFKRKAAGALNLHLCYLVVRMCLCRIGLLELHRSDDTDIKEDRLYYQARCRKTARAVIDFVTSLKKSEVDVFWLPYTAYHFTSAATLILRCALEAEDTDTAQEMKNEVSWDLADICLGHCEAVVEKLSDSHCLETWRRIPHGGQQQQVEEDSASRNMPAQSSHEGPSEQMDGIFEPLNQHVNEPGAESAQTLFQDLMGYNSTPGTIIDNPMFPDLWQLPYLDEYSYRNF
ncbi:putative transcriptional regulatory protein C777,02 [Talaromyces islandicus]|uniref:Putative transcriptional regulatory protein C777,02 n=1 Tax=Talaromyces islandicus TaxID=28573 RepID=A0A0U1LUH1_TALIS|nr:putative transcriptional regulatory protein C777,02 [Talaromyces islandicus]